MVRGRDRSGPSVRLHVQKKGAFNRGGQQAPIEFRGKTTKDVAVSIGTLRALRSLPTTFDRRQLNAANGPKKIDLSCFYVTLRSSRLFLLLFILRQRYITFVHH